MTILYNVIILITRNQSKRADRR